MRVLVFQKVLWFYDTDFDSWHYYDELIYIWDTLSNVTYVKNIEWNQRNS